ncbi:hypothetical protein [Geofilum rhodophaeum]|uniref:hypothetical protein n=1 Tax=Geofilum rhodophaeum TaxID=1965019 RepID=UPI000B52658A|nr:hypothetical protein [Geofilum rhodophaeum]
MKNYNIILLGIVIILFLGCNLNNSKIGGQNINHQTKNELTQADDVETVFSEKLLSQEIPLTIDSRISKLLDKTKVLGTPLVYSFEDSPNTDSIEPLSDEIMDLLSAKKFNPWEGDLSGSLWLSCQINLSKNFKTLIYSVSDGGSGQSILVTYSNSFKFIDHKNIAFEDYAEGYSSSNSWIDKNKIITYESYSGDYPTEDTTYFGIDEQGRIDTLIVKRSANKGTMTTTEIYDNVHESIKNFEHLENILNTDKFLIRIDRLSDGSYRYASWSIKQKASEKPDLILLNGDYIREGTGGNHSYVFKNGDYAYKCSIQKLREYQAPPAVLRVYKGDKEILCQSAVIVK